MTHRHLVFISAALLAASVPAVAQHAPYAGQHTRAVKALSEPELAELRTGQGMGLAKAAELNGYPGPAHVLEHAEALQLSTAQREATQALMQAHRERAKALGHHVIEAERALDQGFAQRKIDAPALSRLTAEIGQRQAALREEHLRTHLAQTALLSAQQIDRYNQLRGYASAGGADAPKPQGGHHHEGHRP